MQMTVTRRTTEEYIGQTPGSRAALLVLVESQTLPEDPMAERPPAATMTLPMTVAEAMAYNLGDLIDVDMT